MLLVVMAVVVMVMVVIDKVMIVARKPQGIWMHYFSLSPFIGSGDDDGSGGDGVL